MQDLLREFIKRPNYKWSELPEKAKILEFWLVVRDDGEWG